MKTRPIVEDNEDKDEDDADPDLADKTSVSKKKTLNFATLVNIASEYLKELSENNHVARAHEFSKQ